MRIRMKKLREEANKKLNEHYRTEMHRLRSSFYMVVNHWFLKYLFLIIMVLWQKMGLVNFATYDKLTIIRYQYYHEPLLPTTAIRLSPAVHAPSTATTPTSIPAIPISSDDAATTQSAQYWSYVHHIAALQLKIVFG